MACDVLMASPQRRQLLFVVGGPLGGATCSPTSPSLAIDALLVRKHQFPRTTESADFSPTRSTLNRPFPNFFLRCFQASTNNATTSQQTQHKHKHHTTPPQYNITQHNTTQQQQHNSTTTTTTQHNTTQHNT